MTTHTGRALLRSLSAAVAVATLVLATAASSSAYNYAAQNYTAQNDTAQPHTGAVDAGYDWAWPLAAPRAVLRPFQAPATRYSAGHRGIDIEAAAGVEVFAPADGVVHFSGRVVDRSVLSIAHSGELLSSYEPIDSAVTTGDSVARGQSIGVIAHGGHCDGGCLHLGVRLRGEYVSPMLLFGGIPRAVLLPMG